MMIQAIEKIKNSQNIAILSHVMPDGDNIGSSLALYSSLISMGKKAKYILDDEIPKIYQFLKNADKIEKPQALDSFDLIVVLDCGDLDRLGASKEQVEKHFIINIDHHISNNEFGNINIVEPDTAATGEIIYRLIRKLGVDIDPDIAECIYTAIATDTGQFQYSNTTSETHRIAGELIKLGVNIRDISEKLYQSNPKEKILLIKKTLESLTFHYDDKIACLYLSKADLEKIGAKDSECDGLINYARDIDGVETGIFLRELDNCKIKAGLRSKKLIDVCKVAQAFNGGGHTRASGFTTEGNIEAVKAEVIREIIKQYEAVKQWTE